MRNRDKIEKKINVREQPNGEHPHRNLAFHRYRRMFQKKSRGGPQRQAWRTNSTKFLLSPKLVEAKGSLLPAASPRRAASLGYVQG